MVSCVKRAIDPGKTHRPRTQMRNETKSKRQLIEETEQLRRRIAELEGATAKSDRVHQALRDSEARWRAMIEHAFDGISIVSPEGVTLYTSPSAYRLMGVTPEEVTGKSILEAIHPEDRPRLIQNMERLLQTPGGMHSDSYRFLHKDGSWHVIESTGKNLVDDPRIGGIVVNYRDITERRKAEEAIKRLNEGLEAQIAERTAELRKAIAELDSFAYAVSHDLRSPLNVIQNYAQMLLESEPIRHDPRAGERLQHILSATRRMAAIIEGLLVLSRATRAEMMIEPVDLGAIAREIDAQLRMEQPERKVTFLVSGDLRAAGDERLLRIALENLLRNAWKFTSKSPSARIEFGVMDQAGEKVYYVRDDGVGFNMEQADTMFEAFKRLHPRTQFEGAGIGLATVKRVILRHGGRIWAHGSPGEGATFYFTLPPAQRSPLG